MFQRPDVIASRIYFLLAIIIFSPVNVLSQPSRDSTTTVSVGQADLVEKADHFYQERIGEKTIHRCPFNVSCSQFFKSSLKKYGMIKGLALFLDRYFYRENISIPSNYAKLNKGNRVVYEDALSDSLLNYYNSN